MPKIGLMNFRPCANTSCTGTEIKVEDRDPEEVRREAKGEINNILRGLRFRSLKR